jgi:hypothetical protein
MHYYYKQFKNKLAAMTWDQLEAMFEQYQEMQSRSVEDEIRQEMIAHELDAREAEDEFERVRYDRIEY